MKAFETFLNDIHPISTATFQAYSKLWKQIKIPKRQILTAPGENEKYMYFLINGVHKAYYLHKNNEYIISFAYPPSFSGIPDSFFTQTPSRYFLETVTESTVLRISFEAHNQFLDANREIETLFRKLTEGYLKGVIQRLQEVMSLSIEDRFTLFTQRSPHLLQLVSQKDLASYLRIDPTNFSKLMNSIHI